MTTAAFNFSTLSAPLSVLAFLGCVALGLALALATAFCLATQRRTWALRLAGGGFALGTAYLVALLGFSVRSREVTVPRGGEKYFCEIDCHLAYSVEDVTRGAAAGGDPARGELWVVRLRTRFEEATISSRRARDLALHPNPRRLAIVDAEGVQHEPIPVPTAAALPPGPPSTDLMTPLRPGESYTTTLAFDLPRAIENPRLLVVEAVPEVRLLIDHEASPLHRKVFLALE